MPYRNIVQKHVVATVLSCTRQDSGVYRSDLQRLDQVLDNFREASIFSARMDINVLILLLISTLGRLTCVEGVGAMLL